MGKFVSYANRFLFKCWIPGTAIIGRNTRIGYWGIGVIIHSNCVIGDNCLIGQNVTIGGKLGVKPVPRIGNDVYIGTGSVIFGDITVGDNVIVGANSVVNCNIPSNCTVAGNPAKIVKNNRQIKYYEIKAE